MTAIRGHLKGQRIDTQADRIVGDIVHVMRDSSNGPAENSFVFVEHGGSAVRARYLSFINYYDLEFVAEREPGAWVVVDPPREFEQVARWHPFGWEGAPPVRTVAWYQVEAVLG